MFQGLTKLRTIVDSVRRRTDPRDTEAHELFTLSLQAAEETVRLEKEMARAWGDADHESWREVAARVLQSLVVMTGVRKGKEPGTLEPNAEGIEAEKVPDELARLANLYAEALVKIDVAKRKERKAA